MYLWPRLGKGTHFELKKVAQVNRTHSVQGGVASPALLF